jgi:hypothetical protein
MADNIQKLEAEELAEKPYDASNPEEVNMARKKAGRKKANRLRIVEAIMQHADGRAWMYGILDRCHIYGSPLVQGDPYATHYMIGESNIGRLILSDVVDAAPDKYLLMIQEAREKK